MLRWVTGLLPSPFWLIICTPGLLLLILSASFSLVDARKLVDGVNGASAVVCVKVSSLRSQKHVGPEETLHGSLCLLLWCKPVSMGPRGGTQASTTLVLWPGDISLLGNDVSPPSSWSLIIRFWNHGSHPLPPSWQVGEHVNSRLCWCFSYRYNVQGWGPCSHSSLKQVFSPRSALVWVTPQAHPSHHFHSGPCQQLHCIIYHLLFWGWPPQRSLWLSF